MRLIPISESPHI